MHGSCAVNAAAYQRLRRSRAKIWRLLSVSHLKQKLLKLIDLENKYAGRLRIKTSDIPSEEIVRSVFTTRLQFEFVRLWLYIFKTLLAKRREQRYWYNDRVV
jgi:hypothetical protein